MWRLANKLNKITIQNEYFHFTGRNRRLVPPATRSQVLAFGSIAMPLHLVS